MYKKSLEKKLKEIFGVKSIIFDSFSLGKEQSVIFVNVFNERINCSRWKNKRYCRVDGRLELFGNKEQFYSGWMHEKYAIANSELKKDLYIAGKENSISVPFNQKMFEKISVDFEYIFCDNDWDRERMQIKNIKTEVIINE